MNSVRIQSMLGSECDLMSRASSKEMQLHLRGGSLIN